MEIKTNYNIGDSVWFFDSDKRPQNREIKSISFYKDKLREELIYIMLSDRGKYYEKDIFPTQVELYGSLND